MPSRSTLTHFIGKILHFLLTYANVAGIVFVQSGDPSENNYAAIDSVPELEAKSLGCRGPREDPKGHQLAASLQIKFYRSRAKSGFVHRRTGGGGVDASLAPPR
jgi:hypothetical protein